MTTPTPPADSHPAWDTTALDTPVVLDIPDQLPDQPDPPLIRAVDALLATATDDHVASDLLTELAHAGVVALRTSSGALELRETLLGWTLVRSWGDPDPRDLAAAARLRAHGLAAERRHGCGSQP